jgi:hypothetical protein
MRNFLRTRSWIEGFGLEKKAIEITLARQKIYHKILRIIMKSRLQYSEVDWFGSPVFVMDA